MAKAKSTYKDPVKPTNVKIAEVKVDGNYLVVKATWDHVKLTTVTDGKGSSQNAQKYDVQWYIKDGNSYKAATSETNSCELRLNLGCFFPYKTKVDSTNKVFGTYMVEFVKVSVRSRAQTNFKASPWGTSAKHTIAKPKMKSGVKDEAITSQQGHAVKFSWEKGTGICTGYRLVHWRENRTSTSAKATSHIPADTLEYTRTCDLTVNEYRNYHRHVCEITPFGPQGYGETKVGTHVFAWPIATALTDVKRTGEGNSAMDRFSVALDNTCKYPQERSDYAKALWSKGLPSSTWGEPAGSTWHEHGISLMHDQFKYDIPKGKTLFTWKVDEGYTDPGEDECVFGRVRMCHDEFVNGETQSNSLLIACGPPKAPTDITFDPSTGRIGWKGASQYPGVRTVLYVEASAGPCPVANVRAEVGSNLFTWGEAERGRSYRVGARNTVDAPLGTLWSESDSSDNIVWIEASSMLPVSPTGLTAKGSGRAELSWDDPPEGVTEVEVSWSSNPDAWSSTDSPKTYAIDHAASSWIVEDEDFKKGGLWYFMVRFRNQAGYGARCSSVSLDMATTPERPMVSVSKQSIVPGDPLVVGWTYDNEDGSEQQDACVAYGDMAVTVAGTDLSTEIATSDLEPGDTVSFRVDVKGASSVRSPMSEPVDVQVRRPIAASVQVPETVRALPIPVIIGDLGDYADAKLRILSAMTYTRTSPDGRDSVYREGDLVCAYSVDDLIPEVDSAQTLPAASAAGLYDIEPMLPGTGSYVAELTVTDIDGNIATASQGFTVDWDIVPTLTEDVEIAYDIRSLAATVTIASQTEWENGEVMDLYRRTQEGYLLVAENVTLSEEDGAWQAVVHDPYATYDYDNSAYRVVKRLPNNSCDWEDFEYAARARKGMVVDFDGVRLELPYNNSRSSSPEKQFAERVHVGGSVTGHWQEGTIGRYTYTADLRRDEDADMVELARRLGDYPGEAFVRMSRGVALPCNVGVSIEEPQNSGKTSVTLTCTRLDSDLWLGTVEEAGA